mgnify:FL=1
MLENTLNKFEGIMLSAHHHRYFINKLVTKILYIKNKTMFEYAGNYDCFTEHRK